MLKIGLTGNIGSGKTWTCQTFEALGVPVFYADLEARKILNHPKTAFEISELFGKHLINDLNEIDRKALAAIVFNDKHELQKLNQLIHPKLREAFAVWAHKHQTHKYVIQEAAILFENGFDKMMDKNICIAAPKELRLERVIKRDQTNREDVLARMGNQWSDERKEKAADFVVYNDGLQMVLPQILKIHEHLNQ